MSEVSALKYVYFIHHQNLYRFRKSDAHAPGDVWCRSGIFGLFRWKWKRSSWPTLEIARRRYMSEHGYFPTKIADMIYRQGRPHIE